MAKDYARNQLFKSQYHLYAEYCYPKEMRQIRNEEIFDKKAQERKKQAQQQQEIQQVSGSQNLINLLTALLRPAMQMTPNGQYQRRSHSVGFQGKPMTYPSMPAPP